MESFLWWGKALHSPMGCKKEIILSIFPGPVPEWASSSWEANTDGPQLAMVRCNESLTFWWCENDTHSLETVFGILNLGLFLGFWYVVWSSLVKLGSSCSSQSAISLGGSKTDTLTTILHPDNYLFLTFSTVFSKSHEIVHTLLSKRLCVTWFCPTVGECECSEHV